MINQHNESICPLCQKSNGCEVQTDRVCWCMNLAVNVPQVLLDKIPSQLKGKCCICNTCIADYLQQQV